MDQLLDRIEPHLERAGSTSCLGCSVPGLDIAWCIARRTGSDDCAQPALAVAEERARARRVTARRERTVRMTFRAFRVDQRVLAQDTLRRQSRWLQVFGLMLLMGCSATAGVPANRGTTHNGSWIWTARRESELEKLVLKDECG